MTKQWKHAKKSAIKKKARRMRLHAREHSRESLTQERIKHDYTPYRIGHEYDWGQDVGKERWWEDENERN